MSTGSSSSDGGHTTLPAPHATVQNHSDMAKAMNISKDQLNLIIMDFLRKQGYAESAQKFADEARLKLREDFDTIKQRSIIKNAIYAGDIQTAIEEINEIDSTIFDRNDDLHFQLLILQLIEMTKAEDNKPEDQFDMPKIAKFAQENLATRAHLRPEWQDRFEKAMSLSAFGTNPAGLSHPDLKALVSPDLRVEVANAALQEILHSTGEEQVTSGLEELLQTRAFAEEEARELGRWPANGVGIGLDSDTPVEGHAAAGPSGGRSHDPDLMEG